MRVILCLILKNRIFYSKFWENIYINNVRKLVILDSSDDLVGKLIFILGCKKNSSLLVKTVNE